MEPKRWQQITEIFETLVERPPEDRLTELEQACAGDAELRREVEILLAADDQAQDFLAEPAVPRARPPEPERPTRVGRYEIIDKIAQGGFGEVFTARDGVLKRLVAVKTCTSPEEPLRRRFVREAEIAGRLEHPNITTVYDSGFHGETPYLVEEYLTGEDLEEQIRRRRPATPAERVATLLQVARGLEYAHAQGVIHRDVKPANIRVLADGRVKIMDFGIAKLENAHTRLTQTGAALGTLAYMAPEQLRGEAVDGRADVFSFGVVAYELLSYRRPFAADSNPAILYQILELEPPPLPERWPACPPRLAALIARCLEKDAAERFPDFTALIAELETLTGELVGVDAPEPPASRTFPERPRPRTPRRGAGRRWAAARWAAAALIAVAVVVAGILGLGGRLRGDRTDESVPVTVTVPAGELVIQALPWAEVVRIADAEDREHPAGPSRYTPLAVSLPPGEYAVTLRHPGHGEPRTCRVEVLPGSTAYCREEFARLDAREFFAQAGW
ncbi:MAG: serine/threonine protein kinase [bacterium]|nr:serine/threonine protein kinase [bacterium]